MLQKVGLPLKFDHTKVNINLIVANKIVLPAKILLCTVNTIEFKFPITTTLSQILDDVIGEGFTVK